ncbi:hypothetical protein [Methylobacterium tarhaniae]|uniref:hypothetical protein n=1 Tax=Methylobacterium tarhaniae TaxID=1187852 RepID=UPI00069E4736|nr:hypothetical protein [Methylobacterium tarhaniae]
MRSSITVEATVDTARGQAMERSGVVVLPARMPHSLWTSAEPATLQVSGVGPFGLIDVNPADEPSRTGPARR